MKSMKKISTILSAAVLMSTAFSAQAQYVRLFSITFPAEAAGSSYGIGVSVSDAQTLSVDWGDGVKSNPVSVKDYDKDWTDGISKVNGKIAGTTVTVYGTDPAAVNYIDLSWDKNTGENCKITGVDVTLLTGVKDINVSSNNITTLDLSKNVAATGVYANNNALASIVLPENGVISTLDLSNSESSGSNHMLATNFNTLKTLKTLNLNFNGVEGIETSLDVSGLAAIQTLSANSCGLSSIDIKGCSNLSALRVNDNLLTSLDCSTMNPSKNAIVFVNNNRLTSFVPAAKMSNLNIINNYLTFATLPNIAPKTFNYAPQNPIELLVSGDKIDLSAQAMVGDKATVFNWTTNGVALESGFTAQNGVFTFTQSVSDAVCTMTNEAFPKLTLTTVPLNIISSGVAAIEGADAPAEYYNLHGVRVDGTQPGIYILRQGSKVSKVIVR